MPNIVTNKKEEERLDLIEIHMGDILNSLKRSKKRMLFGLLIGGFLGIIYAATKSDEFNSQITVMPEVQSKSNNTLGGVSSLASLAGIDIQNLGGNVDAIRPDLYPNVIQSIPFCLYLLEKQVYVRDLKKPVKFEEFLKDFHNRSWLNQFLNFDNNESKGNLYPISGPIQVTKLQERRIEEIRSRVFATFDKKSGIIYINATMPDPVVAATVVGYGLEYLRDYITSYRTEKARKEVDFLTKQTVEARKRYEAAEFALSNFRDRNRALFLNTAKIEEQRIQADYLLAQDVYNNLSKQLELAKIKVAENTPVFKLLEPAKVPLKKSGPNRTLIIVQSAIIGLIVMILVAIYKQIMK